jgi:hypothetical protein
VEEGRDREPSQRHHPNPDEYAIRDDPDPQQRVDQRLAVELEAPRGPEAVGKPSYIYPGTEMDVRESPIGLLDLPFSFCLDTIALPFDIYAVSIKGRPRYDCDWPRGLTNSTNAIPE